MLLGNIASAATLILFLFYFLGRAWTIIKAKALMLEEFGLENISNDEAIDFDKKNYFDLCDGEYGEIITIKSEMPIIEFYVIPIKYDENGLDITSQKINSDNALVSHTVPLKANEPIYLRMDIPEGFPALKIYFRRFDYMKASLNIGYDGRLGGMCPVDYKLSHTFKSFCYYLFK